MTEGEGAAGTAGPEPAGTDPAGTDKPVEPVGGGAPGGPGEPPPEPTLADGAGAALRGAKVGGSATRWETIHNVGGAVHGDQFTGGKTINLLGGRVRHDAPKIPPRTLARAADAFVAPAGWDQARAQLRDRRLTILRGSAGSGRPTAALHGLLDCGTKIVYDLDRAVVVARLDEFLEPAVPGDPPPIPPGSAFLVDDPQDTTGMTGPVLRRLEAALGDCDVRLVFTVSSDFPFADEDMLRYRVTLGSAPTGRAVFDRHLDWHFGPAREHEARMLRTRDDVRKCVEGHLDGDPPCHTAARLAQIIAEEAEDDGGIDLSRVDLRMAQASQDEFETWFDGLPDLDARTLAISLAVLNGLPYEDVASAAEMLRLRLAPPPKIAVADAVERDHFRVGRQHALRIVRARQQEAVLRETYGRATACVVAFEDDHWSRSVLAKAWGDYRLQHVLLGWLGDLARSPSDRIHTQAAAALGRLCLRSFDRVLTSVLIGWAESTTERERDALAVALLEPAGQPELRPIVVECAERWSGGDPEQRATAARIHGIALGDEPAAACAALRRLAKDDEIAVAWAIADSVVDLLERTAATDTAVVLDHLLRWMTDRERSTVGHLTFLRAARDLEADVDGPTGPPVVWPGLLRDAYSSPAVRELVVPAWRVALTAGELVESTEQVLTDWARKAEKDAAARETLTRLVRAVAAQDPRAGTVIVRYARRWLQDDARVPLVAAAIINELDS